MHPLELLRFVARGDYDDPVRMVDEIALALARLDQDDPAAVLTACRRLVQHRPESGVLWSLASRLLTSLDPVKDAFTISNELENDHTIELFAAGTDGDEPYVVVPASPSTMQGLAHASTRQWFVLSNDVSSPRSAGRRGDEGPSNVTLLPLHAAREALTGAALLVIEATGAGPEGIAAPQGAFAVAAAAHHLGVPALALCRNGTLLPAELWGAMVHVLSEAESFTSPVDIVPTSLLSEVATSAGRNPARTGLLASTVPLAPELVPHRHQ